MIKSVTASSSQLESMFEFGKLGTNEANFYITKIDGLDEGKATITTIENSFSDGSRFSSSRINERNIIIYTTFPASMDAQNARRKQSKLFPLKEEVTLTFVSTINGDTDKKRIRGYVETNLVNIFDNPVTGQISIKCPNPNFILLGEGGSEAIYVTASGSEAALSIDNPGDPSSKFQIFLNSASAVRGYAVTNSGLFGLKKSNEDAYSIAVRVPRNAIPEKTQIAGQVYKIKTLSSYTVPAGMHDGLVSEGINFKTIKTFSDESGNTWSQIVPGDPISGPIAEGIDTADHLLKVRYIEDPSPTIETWTITSFAQLLDLSNASINGTFIARGSAVPVAFTSFGFVRSDPSTNPAIVLTVEGEAREFGLGTVTFNEIPSSRSELSDLNNWLQRLAPYNAGYKHLIYKAIYEELIADDKITLLLGANFAGSSAETLIDSWLDLQAFAFGTEAAVSSSSTVEIRVDGGSIQILQNGTSFTAYSSIDLNDLVIKSGQSVLSLYDGTRFGNDPVTGASVIYTPVVRGG